MHPLQAQLLRAEQHTIRGRLGNDPDLRTFDNGGCICRLNLAVNKPGAKKGDGQDPDWFRAELWDAHGMAAADKLHKGDLVEVTGRASTNSWQAKDGSERTDIVIRVDEWRVIPREGGAAPAPAATRAAAPAAPATWHSQADDGGDDVPF
jgi:single-strand DNA-binding protein